MNVSSEGLIKVQGGDSLSKYSWAIYGNYTTLSAFARMDKNGRPTDIVNKDLIYTGETLIHLRDYKNGTKPGGGRNGNVGTNPPKGNTPVPDSGSSIETTNMFHSLALETEHRGYFRVTSNVSLKPGQRLLLVVGDGYDAVDITRGFSAFDHIPLLDLLVKRDYLARSAPRTIGCRLYVVEEPAAPEPGSHFSIYGWMGTVSTQELVTKGISNELQLPLPVVPISFSVGRGWDAAGNIGTRGNNPFIPYKQKEGFFVGRYLSKNVGNRHWFLYGNQLETVPAKRAIDCTTFVMSCYQNTQGAKYANIACDNIGAGPATAMMTGQAMKDYIAANPGSYFILKYDSSSSTKESHIMMYSNGMVREFTAQDADAVLPGEGFQQMSLATRDFNYSYKLRTMP